MNIIRTLLSYTRPELTNTAAVHQRRDPALPGEQPGDVPAQRGHLCRARAPQAPRPRRSCGHDPPARARCAQSPAGLREPSEPRLGPAGRCGHGQRSPARPVRDLLPSDSRRRGGRGDTAAAPRHLSPLPAPQPGHGDCVPHCGTSALSRRGDVRREAAGSPQPCRSPRAALTSPGSPAAAAALGDAPEPSPHLHRPHRPPGGCYEARRVM